MEKIKHIIIDDSGIRQVDSALVPNDYNKFDGTLFGPSNFIYEVLHDKLNGRAFNFLFCSTESTTLHLNLEIVNTDLTIVWAELLLIKYLNPLFLFSNLILTLRRKNPLGFNLSYGHQIYEYRIMNFLMSVTYGMKPDIPWRGEYNSNGLIVTDKNGRIICYHIYNPCMFLNHLFDCIELDISAVKRYKKGKKQFIKLPLHIKFNDRVFMVG